MSKKYADEQDLRMAYNGSCDNCRQGFEVGANEVLDLLYNTAVKEDWITNPKDGVRKFFEMYKELKSK